MTRELVSVASDEVVVLRDGALVTYDDLSPATTLVFDGLEVTTLPRPGERLATIATTNDLHFGEIECGHVDGYEKGPFFSVPLGAEPYPAMMNRLAVAEIATHGPDAVIVKGDLTSRGRPEEYAAFLDCYAGTFGERLTHVRGNHDCYRGQTYANTAFQEVAVPGAIVAVLDTCRPGQTNGTISREQLEQLDELAARADVPVIVLGHHPIWDARTQPRNDNVFSLTPEPTEGLLEVFARRPRLVTYAAGHTHRTHVIDVDGVPFVEVATVKDFPGVWCEYQVFSGGILQVVRRISHPAALAWTEMTRAMFDGAYGLFASGSLEERCRLVRADRRAAV